MIEIKMLADLAHELLSKYYEAKRTCIWEYSGDNYETEMHELEQYCARLSKRIDYLKQEVLETIAGNGDE